MFCKLQFLLNKPEKFPKMSFYCKDFDFKYCNDFLERLLSGEAVKFDFEKSHCVEDTSRIYLMAIDYKQSTPTQFLNLEIAVSR